MAWKFNPFTRRLDYYESGGGGVTDHGALTGLADDDHLQYLLLAGRTGGQIAHGSDTGGEDFILRSNPDSDGVIYLHDDITSEQQRVAIGPRSTFFDGFFTYPIRLCITSQNAATQFQYSLAFFTFSPPVTGDAFPNMATFASGGTEAVPECLDGGFFLYRQQWFGNAGTFGVPAEDWRQGGYFIVQTGAGTEWGFGGAGAGISMELGTCPDGSTFPTARARISSTGRVQIPQAAFDIRNLEYTWPASHTTDSYLRNDGAGALTWVDLDAVYQALDADLTAIAVLSGTGYLVHTGAGTWAERTITVTDSSTVDFTITNGNGVSGNTNITAVVLPGGIDHGALADLTADDHTQYLLLLGRSGGQDANGGTGVADHFDLFPSSASGYYGTVRISPVAIDYSTNGSFPTSDPAALSLWAGGMSYGLHTYVAGIVLDSTMTQTANAAGGLPLVQLFMDRHIHAPSSSSVTAFATDISFFSRPTIQNTHGSDVTTSGYRGVDSQPIVTTTSTGLLTMGELTHVYADATISNNATVTTRRGLWFLDSGGTGAVGTAIGVDIDALADATLSIGIRNASTEVATPTVGTITAVGSTIPRTAKTIRLNNTSGGALTLTSTPTIADGQDGQILHIFNGGAQSVTIQDQGTLANSNLRLSAGTITLATRDNITLQFSTTIGDWIQIAQVNVI